MKLTLKAQLAFRGLFGGREHDKALKDLSDAVTRCETAAEAILSGSLVSQSLKKKDIMAQEKKDFTGSLLSEEDFIQFHAIDQEHNRLIEKANDLADHMQDLDAQHLDGFKHLVRMPRYIIQPVFRSEPKREKVDTDSPLLPTLVKWSTKYREDVYNANLSHVISTVFDFCQKQAESINRAIEDTNESNENTDRLEYFLNEFLEVAGSLSAIATRLGLKKDENENSLENSSDPSPQ